MLALRRGWMRLGTLAYGVNTPSPTLGGAT